jgi:hypothetical protein
MASPQKYSQVRKLKHETSSVSLVNVHRLVSIVHLVSSFTVVVDLHVPVTGRHGLDIQIHEQSHGVDGVVGG